MSMRISAQSVTPNPKCEGCLHYSAQQGPTGVCLIGLRPWLCGDGLSPAIGYAPLTSQIPENPGDQAPNASVVGGSNENTLMFTGATTVLGDEHAMMAKSLYADAQSLIQKSCSLHSQHTPVQGQSNQYAPIFQACTCADVDMRQVAKSLKDQLPNHLRVKVTDADIANFVKEHVGR